MSDPVIIAPAFVSTIPDTGDATKLGPTAWNAARLVSGGTPGDLVARDPASPTGASWFTPANTPGQSPFQTLGVARGPVSLPVNPPENTPVDLWTVALPANQLGYDGAVLDLLAWGEFTAGSGSDYRSFAVYLNDKIIGGLARSGVGQATIFARATIVRVSSSEQRTLLYGFSHTEAGPVIPHTWHEDLTIANVLRVTGTQVHPPWSDGGVTLFAAVATQY